MVTQYLFVSSAFLYRFAMLGVSMRNESLLRTQGGKEYGRTTSRWLAIVHVAFYSAATIEGVVHPPGFDLVSQLGLATYIFGAAMLLWVSRLLGRLWTVKLIIAPNHTLVAHWLFSTFRHPNYYLNIIPELIGFGLTLHAFTTLAVGLPIYMVPLCARILEEQKVMRQKFSSY